MQHIDSGYKDKNTKQRAIQTYTEMLVTDNICVTYHSLNSLALLDCFFLFVFGLAFSPTQTQKEKSGVTIRQSWGRYF